MDSPGMHVCALSRDVFFSMRIRTVMANLGYRLTSSATEAELVASATDADIAVVDFNQGVDWNILAPLLQGTTPVIAFGSHTNVDGFRAAKEAGVTRVVSNGEFSRNLPALLLQYRK